MAVMSKRTTRLLAGLAVVFVIVLIILCLVPPSGGPPHGHQAGKSSGTIPEDIITGTPDTSTESSTSTSTVSTSTSEVYESHSTESTTKVSASTTTAATSPFEEEYETTPFQDANDTDIEDDIEISDTTTDLWSRSTTTSSTRVSSTAATTVESSTDSAEDKSTTDDGLWIAYNDTEEATSTSTLETESTSEVSSTTHHYDEVHNETSTEVYSLFNETTADDFSEAPELTTTTDLEEETTTLTTVLDEKPTSTTVLDEETTLTTVVDEETALTTVVDEETTLTTVVDETTSSTTVLEEETTSPTTTDTTAVVPSSTIDHQTEHHKNESTADVCTHADCKELAARMLDMMDHRADPCQDFYQYACGGVEDDPFLHPEDPAQQVFHKLLGTLRAPVSPDDASADPAKLFYKTCVNHPHSATPEMVAKLREQVNKYGLLDPRVLETDPKLAQLYEFVDEDPFDLQEMVADFLKLDYALFFDVGVDVDTRDKNKFAVRLSLPLDGFNSGLSESIDTTFCMTQHQHTMDDAVKTGTHVDLNVEYEKLHECRLRGLGLAHLVNRLKEAAVALNLTEHVTDADLAERLVGETAIDTEFLLQDIKDTWPEPSEVRYMVINKNFTEYTTEQLDREDILTNLVNWKALLEKVVGRPVWKVQVYHEADLRSVMKNVEIIAKDRAASLRNMLLMLWGARLYTDILSPEGRGAPGSPEYCVGTTQYLMPDIAAEIFLKSFSVLELEAMGRQVTRVVNSVKKTVSAAVQHKPGVSEKLRDKLQRTFTQVGAAEYLKELSEDVAKSTENLFLEDNYVDNVLLLLRRRRAMLYSIYDGFTSDHAALWNHFSVPHSITATTLYSANSILIPEGIMTAPYLYPHLLHIPDYITFAGIGHIVAHEFLHAIDTTGIKFDGLIGEELSRPPAMDEREYCFMALLNSNFTLQVRNSTTVSFRLPRELHLNEQMVDSEATRLAWLSYVHGDTAEEGTPWEVVTDRPMRRRRTGDPTVSTESSEAPLPWLGLSPHQVFLLRTAQTQCARTSDQDITAIMEQEHLPARLRVNLALVHEPLFAEAFGCPADSKMAAEYTCPYIVGHMHAPPH